MTKDTSLTLLKGGAGGDVPAVVNDAREDKEFAKESIRDTITTGIEALKELKTLAASTDDPKAYRVLASTIDSLVSASKTLVDLSLPPQGQSPSQPADSNGLLNPSGPKTVFLGSPSELQRMMEERRKGSDSVGAEIDRSLG